jgi:hypothetical protein
LRLTQRQEESTSFGKKSKNFWPFDVRVVVTLTLYKQEFFGSFLQKRTACFLLFAAPTGRLWQESLSSQSGITWKLSHSVKGYTKNEKIREDSEEEGRALKSSSSRDVNCAQEN